MTLEDLAAQEDHLLSQIAARGYFEERGPQVEAAQLPQRWQEILAAYVDRIDSKPSGLEALARAVFIVWYAWNEPWQLTGIRDLPPNLEARALRELDIRMATGSCPRELLSMLRGYGPGLPFDLHPELTNLNGFLRAIEGSYSPDTPLGCMDGRGALGKYWRSRSDASFQ